MYTATPFNARVILPRGDMHPLTNCFRNQRELNVISIAVIDSNSDGVIESVILGKDRGKIWRNLRVYCSVIVAWIEDRVIIYIIVLFMI